LVDFFNIYLPLRGVMPYNRAMKANLAAKALVILNLVCLGQAQQQSVKTVPVKPTVSVAGKDLFRQYCAVCHGTDGKGAGPAAAAMKSFPTDLTQISRKNGGKFPEERMLRILTGEETLTAHGSKEMPIWGVVLDNGTSSLELAHTRLHALLRYLEDMQAK
jgi:mono/diheme cytochrome c family protein